MPTRTDKDSPNDPTKKPPFAEWLANEGAIYSAAHLGGANFRSRINDLMRAASPILGQIKAEVMEANPRPEGVSQEEYNQRIMEKVEEVYLERHG